MSLFDAARNGNLAKVKKILELDGAGHDVDVNAKSFGNTPLHYAGSRGHEPVVKYLLAFGARVNEPGFQGQTPLHCAASRGHVATVQTLVEHGGNAHAMNDRGQTPLQAAAAWLKMDFQANTTTSRMAVIQYLVRHDAGVNVTTIHTAALLHVAVAHGGDSNKNPNTWRIIQNLVDLGVDCHARDEDGNVALFVAAAGLDLNSIFVLAQQTLPTLCSNMPPQPQKKKKKQKRRRRKNWNRCHENDEE